MCFPFDAIVPDLPPGFTVIAGGAAGEHLTLTASDGTPFSAYLARAEGPVGVVVLPDVRGLFRFYEQLAERFAAAGHPAIAIDYFGRTAGLGPRDEGFEWSEHIPKTTPETVALDTSLPELTASAARSAFAPAPVVLAAPPVVAEHAPQGEMDVPDPVDGVSRAGRKVIAALPRARSSSVALSGLVTVLADVVSVPAAWSPSK